MAATRFRRDVTEEDICLSARVKAYLMKSFNQEKIKLENVPKTYQQRWTQEKGKWVAADRVPDPHSAIGVRLADFRYIIRGIQREVNVTEGRIIYALEKISLLRYTGLCTGWKTVDTPPLVLLENERIFETTIQRRRSRSPAARLTSARQGFDQDVAKGIAEGLAPDLAWQLAMVSHGELADLEAAVLTEKEKKPERYAEMRKKIEGSKSRF